MSKEIEKIPHYEPFDQFKEWLEQACSDDRIVEPTAMCLATVNEAGEPSSRMILLKKFDDRGFCFFTNLNSRKGKELTENQNVALCFYWGVFGHQIRIEGRVEKVSLQEADDYFASRRRGSQIGAWASKQSCELPEWKVFEDRIAEVTQNFEGKDVPRPPFWSGFRVVPKTIEFWDEGEFRIHKRTVYEKYLDGWKKRMIYP